MLNTLVVKDDEENDIDEADLKRSDSMLTALRSKSQDIAVQQVVQRLDGNSRHQTVKPPINTDSITKRGRADSKFIK